MISRYTAMVIQNPKNDICCRALGEDKESGKWVGTIDQFKEGHFHTTLVSSNPIFESAKLAVLEMERIVKKIKDLKL